MGNENADARTNVILLYKEILLFIQESPSILKRLSLLSIPEVKKNQSE